MKIWQIGAIVALSSYMVWGDDPVAVSTASGFLSGLDTGGRGQIITGLLTALGGVATIIMALVRKGAWLPKLIKLAPWFARPFVKNYLDKLAVAAEMKFVYPQNASPEQIIAINIARKEWVVGLAKIGPIWVQWFFSNLTDEQINLMVEYLILRPTREFRKELAK